MSARLVIVALALVGCAARGIIEPAPRKEIVAKRDRYVIRYEVGDKGRSEISVVDRYWLVAADGTGCAVSIGMWKATYVGQVLACPYAWRQIPRQGSE